MELINKRIVLLIVYLVCNTLSAQNWCPQGARWLYEEFHMIGKYFRKYEYTHDTVIADKQVKGIETTRIQLLFSALDPANGDFTQVYSGIHITKLDTLYLYESNDSVFVYIHPEFKLMYQFNPTIDQQFEVGNYAAQLVHQPCSTDEHYYVLDSLTIESKNTVNVDGQSLSRSTFRNGKYNYGYLFDGIGTSACFFPERVYSPEFDTVIDGGVCGQDNGLICYFDNIRGEIVFGDLNVNPEWGVTCQWISTTQVGVNEFDADVQDQVILFPNPVENILNISTNDEETLLVRIFDLNGNVVQEEIILNGANMIDLSNLHRGLYIVDLSNGISNRLHKIVKM